MDMPLPDVRMPRWSPVETTCRGALRLLHGLSNGETVKPDRLHRLRISVRRLQAWFELLGDHGTSRRLARRVSRLSRLRTLQVFEQWLVRQQAAASDLRIIREAIRDETERHVKEKTFHLIRATVETLGGKARKPAPVHAKQVWNRHRATVTRLLRDAKAHPKRKRLHALRLALKQLRYRLEWTVPQTARQRRVIFQLKKAQRCLGAYEELAAFRKLAK